MKESLILEHSPVLCAKDSWPTLIEFILFFSFSLVVTSDCVLEFIQKPKRTIYSKRFFFVIFSIYLILHSALLLIPFPFEEFSLHFLSEELPIFLLFVSMGTLAIWLGTALILKNDDSRLLYTIYTSVFVLLFIYTLITQILIHKTPVFTDRDDMLTLYLPLVAHVISFTMVFPANIYYCFKLRQLYSDENILEIVKTRIKLLFILLLLLFGVFLVRFLIELLTLILLEEVSHFIQTNIYDPCERDENCFSTNLYSFLMAVVSEFIPAATIYAIAVMLKSPIGKAKTRKTTSTNKNKGRNKGCDAPLLTSADGYDRRDARRNAHRDAHRDSHRDAHGDSHRDAHAHADANLDAGRGCGSVDGAGMYSPYFSCGSLNAGRGLDESAERGTEGWRVSQAAYTLSSYMVGRDCPSAGAHEGGRDYEANTPDYADYLEPTYY